MTDPTHKGGSLDGSGSPEGEPEPSVEEIEQQRTAVIQLIAGTLKVYFPGVPDEALIQVARVSFLESEGLARVFDDAVPGSPNQTRYPFWMVRFWFTKKPTEVTVVASPKTLDQAQAGDMGTVLRQLGVLGLLSVPLVRGFARMYGVEFEFQQGNVDPTAPKSRLIPGR